MWAQLVSAGLGLWLLAAPGVLGYGGGAGRNDRIVGPVIASVALIALWEVMRPVRWANLPLGLWLVVAPWIVGYHGAARPLSVLVGAIVAACALAPGTYRPGRFGGGWAALWAPADADSGGSEEAR